MRKSAVIAVALLFLCLAVYGTTVVQLSGKSSLVGNLSLGIRLVATNSLTLPYDVATLKVGLLSGNHFLPCTELVGIDEIPRALLWNDMNNVRAISLPDRVISGGFNDLAAPVTEFCASDKVVIASKGVGGGPVRVTEYSLISDVLTLLLDFNLGDVRTQLGSSCVLSNNQTVIAFHDKSPVFTNEFVCRVEVGWRETDLESGGPNRWITNIFELPTFFVRSENPANLSMTQGADGLVYLFYTMDTMGRVGIARFQKTILGIELVDNTFVTSGSSYSISDEFPLITSIHDNNRIVLTYQGQISTTYTNCVANSNRPASDNIIISQVLTNLAVSLVTNLNWPSLHVNFPLLVSWPRTDGIYFFVDRFSSCDISWRAGRMDYVTGIQISEEIAGGDLLSRSDDGYVYFEAENGTKTLARK